MPRLEIAEETVPRRAFAWAVDWPGWCRGGKTPLLAREALITVAPRYAVVAGIAGLVLPEVAAADLHAIETVDGGSGTEFGVPSTIVALDRLPATPAEAERLAALVAAAWTMFDRVADAAPQSLRKGPRGGGRDRDKMVHHAIGADHAYAIEIGVRYRSPDPADRAAIEAERAAILDVLAEPSDGSPLAGRKWTARYAARRIAWHALDHAWEMQDRSEPAFEAS